MSVNDFRAENLKDRFIEEQEYVLRFTELLQYKFSSDFDEINNIVNTLEKYNLIDRKVFSNNLSLYQKSDVSEEVEEILNNLRNLKPFVEVEIAKTRDELSKIKIPPIINGVSCGSFAGDCINHFIEVLEDNPTETIIEHHQILLKESLLKNEKEESVFIVNEKGTIDELLNYCVDAALYLIPVRKVNDLDNVLNAIEEIEIAGRLLKKDTEINPLRQGFITLTTIFDATVFDLMKLALNRDFFNLISLFGKQDKISLDKISQFSSFDEFRNEIIEEQLKSKYLKEILNILHSNGVTLTDKNIGDEFIHLLEMVSRRNIHIHNRGVVDNKYLEMNNGKPRYNIYNLKAGEIASIDAGYWGLSNRLCTNCVNHITDWINTLPASV